MFLIDSVNFVASSDIINDAAAATAVVTAATVADAVHVHRSSAVADPAATEQVANGENRMATECPATSLCGCIRSRCDTT